VLRDSRVGAATGRGVCVGRPTPDVTVRVIRITDEPIERWSDDLVVPDGEIGEITVRGPVVTEEYYARPESTRLAKIRENGAVVHRMGDVGSFDEQGRLWMCGRKGQRVVTRSGTLFTVPVEEILNTHLGVARTALVGLGARGAQHPVLLVERDPQCRLDNDTLLAELAGIVARHDVTRSLEDLRIYPHKFPVDTRHNAKIEREKLTIWAGTHPVTS
jgi:olefin beta-lactone synthetase